MHWKMCFNRAKNSIKHRQKKTKFLEKCMAPKWCECDHTLGKYFQPFFSRVRTTHKVVQKCCIFTPQPLSVEAVPEIPLRTSGTRKWKNATPKKLPPKCEIIHYYKTIKCIGVRRGAVDSMSQTKWRWNWTTKLNLQAFSAYSENIPHPLSIVEIVIRQTKHQKRKVTMPEGFALGMRPEGLWTANKRQLFHGLTAFARPPRDIWQETNTPWPRRSLASRSLRNFFPDDLQFFLFVRNVAK